MLVRKYAEAYNYNNLILNNLLHKCGYRSVRVITVIAGYHGGRGFLRARNPRKSKYFALTNHCSWIWCATCCPPYWFSIFLPCAPPSSAGWPGDFGEDCLSTWTRSGSCEFRSRLSSRATQGTAQRRQTGVAFFLVIFSWRRKKK